MPAASRSTLSSWQKLADHQRDTTRLQLRDLFTRDAARFEKFSLALDGLLLDFSKQLVTGETMDLLRALARECGVEPAIAAMFAGGIATALLLLVWLFLGLLDGFSRRHCAAFRHGGCLSQVAGRCLSSWRRNHWK